MTLTRIGHLETVIRVPARASVLPGRLDELARERLPSALEVSLDRILADAGEVLVLREVDLELSLDGHSSLGAEEIADRWAHAAGTAISTLVTRGNEHDVIRFANEATFVSCFVRDLLAGRAWTTWCYGAFTPLRELPIEGAIARVLADHANILGEILRLLVRDGTLEPALSTLRADEAAAVWRSALTHGPKSLNAASALPIAAAALDIARQLGLLAARAPEPTALAATHRRWAPQPLPWSSPGALADAVCGALAELTAGSFTRPSTVRARERAASAATGYDWLDRERLVAGIVSLLDPASPGSAGPSAEPDADTQALRRAIEAVARATARPVDGSADDAVTALRLLAALAQRHPELAARPETASEIHSFLTDTVHGEAEGAVAARSTTGPKGGTTDGAPEWRRSETAGVLLLARSVADIRLHTLASRLGLPAPGLASEPAPALLLSLGLAVAGTAGAGDDGQLDPGLVALIGRDDPMAAVELAGAWASTDAAGHRALRSELAELAAGQRLDRPRPVPDCCHPALAGLARGTAARAAHLAILAWARWLPGLSDSTPAFLLAQLLRRGGSVHVSADAVRAVLDPRPLDLVVDLAGYLEPLYEVPWLGGRAVHVTRGQA